MLKYQQEILLSPQSPWIKCVRADMKEKGLKVEDAKDRPVQRLKIFTETSDK